jgi:hypothetical protein
MTILLLSIVSCKKDKFDVRPASQQTGPGLYFSADNGLRSTNSTTNSIVSSGQTVSANAQYRFSFYLGSGATGTYIWKTGAGTIIYMSPIAENTKDSLLPAGTYTIDVNGTYLGTPFSYTNITLILSTPGSVSTSPVRLYNFTVSAGTASVSVAVNKAILNPLGITDTLFYCKQINGIGFMTSQITSIVGDTCYFNLTWPGATNSLIQFIVKKQPANIWMNPATPGVGYTVPSTLYDPTSTAFWQFNYTISTTTATITALNGNILLNYAIAPALPIPGTAGDWAANSYTVRHTGLTFWFLLSSQSNMVVYYYVDTTIYPGNGPSAMTLITPVAWAPNPNYGEVTFPAGTFGEVHIVVGNINGVTFAPYSLMYNSGLYVTTLSQYVITL